MLAKSNLSDEPPTLTWAVSVEEDWGVVDVGDGLMVADDCLIDVITDEASDWLIDVIIDEVNDWLSDIVGVI